jgi:CopG-like RHH_1 or ribbon-helix-helix domain, RHH_5
MALHPLPPNDVSPAKSPRVAFYPPPEIKDKLEKLANIERRSISQMALLLVEEGLERAQKEGRFNASKDD